MMTAAAAAGIGAAWTWTRLPSTEILLHSRNLQPWKKSKLQTNRIQNEQFLSTSELVRGSYAFIASDPKSITRTPSLSTTFKMNVLPPIRKRVLISANIFFMIEMLSSSDMFGFHNLDR